MPIKSGALTVGERAVIEAYTELGDIDAAAARAGVTRRAVERMLHRPETQAALAAHQRSVLVTELLPLANKAMRQVLESDRTPAAARVAAAKLVYDRAWGADAAAAGKQPHEMSRDELSAAIAKLEAAAAERARDITPPAKPAVFD